MKEEVIEKIRQLADGDMASLIRALYNYHSASELEQFLEYLKEELT